jgi:hypothetical protein
MKKQAAFSTKEKEKQFQYYPALHIGIVVREVPDEDASFIYMEGTTPYGSFPPDPNKVLEKDLIKCYYSRMTSHYTHGGPYQPLMRGTWVVVAYSSHINLGIILGTIPDKRQNVLPKGQHPVEGQDDALGMLYHHHSGVWMWVHRNGDIEIAHPSETNQKWTYIKIGQKEHKGLSKRFRQIVENEESKTVPYKLGTETRDIKPQGVPQYKVKHSKGSKIRVTVDSHIVFESDNVEAGASINRIVALNPNTPPAIKVSEDSSHPADATKLWASRNTYVNGFAVVVDITKPMPAIDLSDEELGG